MLGEQEKAGRDEVMARLDQAGIETRPLFYPLNQMPPYYDADLKVPNATSCSARGFNLPTHEHLSTDDLARVVDTLTIALDS